LPGAQIEGPHRGVHGAGDPDADLASPDRRAQGFQRAVAAVGDRDQHQGRVDRLAQPPGDEARRLARGKGLLEGVGRDDEDRFSGHAGADYKAALRRVTRERADAILAAVTLLVTDPLYLAHHAPGHVECPERVQAILDHFKARGLMERLTPLAARDATTDEIALMHGRAYIEVVREVSARGGGWFDSDTYLNEHSYAAALRAAGGVLSAVEALRDGRDRTALCLVRPPGHHALPERGMGFCLFNNVAIAARFLKRRVLIVDWDVHHGNGTQ